MMKHEFDGTGCCVHCGNSVIVVGRVSDCGGGKAKKTARLTLLVSEDGQNIEWRNDAPIKPFELAAAATQLMAIAQANLLQK